MKLLNYGYPYSNALLQFCLKLKPCEEHKSTCPTMKCDVMNEIKLFPTVYPRRPYMLGYTIANFRHYPISRHITEASALDCSICVLQACNYQFSNIFP